MLREAEAAAAAAAVYMVVLFVLGWSSSIHRYVEFTTSWTCPLSAGRTSNAE